jgi:hypothetical protein
MSCGPYQLKVGDLTLEVEGTFEADRWCPKFWVDSAHLLHGDERIDLDDLLEAVQRSHRGWYWRDWLEERVVDDIKRAREVA